MSRNVAAEKVVVAYCFGTITPEFHLSLCDLIDFDKLTGKNRIVGRIPIRTTNIADGRNAAVRKFLESTDADWLCFIDTDQEFAPDTVERLVASADPDERPILSALIMAFRPERQVPVGPACVVLSETDPPMPITPLTIPADQHWQVAAIGTGCVVIHRKVLEAVGKEFTGKTPFPWFDHAPWERVDQKTGQKVLDAMGEDYTFCFRAQHLGFPCFVDTTIDVGHVKGQTLYSHHFWAQMPTGALPDKTFVIIPMKDNLKLTKALVRSLYEQGGYDGLFLLDNGSNPETKRWLERQEFAEIFNCEGMGIHEMWNVGAEMALRRWPKVNLAFLNNDLRIGPNFLAGLRDVLRDDEVGFGVVCPNYDGRPGTGPVRLHGICANRYDGTGGLAGFAYMARGELFAQGYRFPADAKWWYGDNDLTLTLDKNGIPYGMALDVTVEHVDGGGKTGDWDAYVQTEQHQRDLLAFLNRHPEQAEALGVELVEAAS